MHILLLQTYSTQPTPAYEKIASELRAIGQDVWVGTPNQSGDLEWHDGKQIVARSAASNPKLRLPLISKAQIKLAKYRQVRRLIRHTQPDIVQINSNDLYYLFVPWAMPPETRFILDYRQINEQFGAGIYGRLKAWLRNKSRDFFSRFIFDHSTFLHPAGARKVLGERWAKWSTVVPMGVDAQFLTATRDRIEPETPDRVVKFIYIGRLAQRRRLELILEAADQVRHQTDRFRIAFIGHDTSEGHYNKIIKQLQLEEFVSIYPAIPYEDVPQAVLSHDVALAYVPELPVDWQYHPTLKILEYRALGIPVIASDFLPNRELVRERENGLLFQNNSNSLAKAMLMYINDPNFLARSLTVAQNMREGLTWNMVAWQYLELYKQLKGDGVSYPARSPERWEQQPR